MPPAPNDLLTSLLRDVSRSFHLTMRVLPGAIRPQISLAYLLARTTDTIADTEIVPVSERLQALDQLRARILGQSSARLDFSRFNQSGTTDGNASAAEQALLGRIEEALAVLAGFSTEDQQRIRDVLTTITSGQELDLMRFTLDSPLNRPAATFSPTGGEGRDEGARFVDRENVTDRSVNPKLPNSIQRGNENLPLPGERAGVRAESPAEIIALANDVELDDYTYRVAGCVGEFWTKMCRAHLFPRATLDDSFLLSNGVRFGKGLQLVNVLRDLPADLRKGRCYLPGDALTAAGLAPTDLFNPASESRLRPVYNHWLDIAEAHLAAGWDYTNALPRGQARVRLACAWPILIGVKTLGRLRKANVLDPNERIKVSRAEVKRIICRSVITYPLPGAWKNLFASTGGN